MSFDDTSLLPSHCVNILLVSYWLFLKMRWSKHAFPNNYLSLHNDLMQASGAVLGWIKEPLVWYMGHVLLAVGRKLFQHACVWWVSTFPVVSDLWSKSHLAFSTKILGCAINCSHKIFNFLIKVISRPLNCSIAYRIMLLHDFINPSYSCRIVVGCNFYICISQHILYGTGLDW